jgi:hypothetical protein
MACPARGPSGNMLVVLLGGIPRMGFHHRDAGEVRSMRQTMLAYGVSNRR